MGEQDDSEDGGKRRAGRWPVEVHYVSTSDERMMRMKIHTHTMLTTLLPINIFIITNYEPVIPSD